MNQDKILDKIQKLLALSENNPSVEEAAAAAAQAQTLMSKYNISKYMIASVQGQEDKEQIVNFGKEEPLDNLGKRSSNWKSLLGDQIARANYCRTYTIKFQNFEGKQDNVLLCIIGKDNDVQTVRYLYQYLRNEIDRLCKRDNDGYGKAWANSYKIGAVRTVAQKLKEAKQKAEEDVKEKVEGEGVSLIHVKNALARAKEVEDAVQDMINEVASGKEKFKSKLVPSAFLAGQEAAREIDINGDSAKLDSGHEGLEKPKKKLGNGD